MSVDEIIAALAETPLRVNNLFQLDDGTWRANVRDDSMLAAYRENPKAESSPFEFGTAATPAKALIAAAGNAGYNWT